MAGVVSAIYSCEAGPCLGDATRTGHCTGSGHGGHAPRHTSRADLAFPKRLLPFLICGESRCATCCYALQHDPRSRIVLCPCSIDSAKGRAFGSSQKSNSLWLSTCITVQFLGATITVRVRNNFFGNSVALLLFPSLLILMSSVSCHCWCNYLPCPWFQTS